MERELWKALYQLAQECEHFGLFRLERFTDAEIVGVYFWAVIHDRPVSWACDEGNWPKKLRKRLRGGLPSQSTMSRRLRTTEVLGLLAAMENSLVKVQRRGWVWIVDGKPLPVGSHSKDRDAAWGRAGRSYAKGYKLHAIYGADPLPVAWDVAPLNESEPDHARQLLSSWKGAGGYLLGDKIFDSNPVHASATAVGLQLVAERKRPTAGLGHRRHTAGRLRSMALLQTRFGQELYRCRDQVEQQFGWLTNHGGGLAPLPNWVRREYRVRLWVQAKLLAHTVYTHRKHPNSALAAA